MLANDNGAFIDLRSAQDFRQGHIAGAKNMPLAELHDHVGKIRTAKNRPLVIYDHDGMNTAAAARMIVNTHVTSVPMENAAPGLYASWSPSSSPTSGMRSCVERVASAHALVPWSTRTTKPPSRKVPATRSVRLGP
mgnify:CR=1 FL=1